MVLAFALDANYDIAYSANTFIRRWRRPRGEGERVDAADTIRELMTRYDEARAAWIQQYGTDVGFDAWFTKQVCA